MVNIDQIRKLKQLYGTVLVSSSYLTVGTVLGSALGFLFWTISARILSSADLGLGAGYISAMGLIAQIASFGFGATFIRFLRRMGPERNGFINASIVITSLGTLFLFSLVVIYEWMFSLSFIQTRQLSLNLLLLFIATLSFNLSQLIDRIYIAYERTHFLLIRQQITFILKLAGLVAFGSMLGLTGFLLAIAISESAALILSFIILTSRLLPDYRFGLSFAWEAVWEKLKFTLGNHLSQTLWNAPQFILPMLVLLLWGAEANAQFYVHWLILSMFLVIPVSVSTAAFAQASSQDDPRQTNLWNIMLLTIYALIPLILVMWFIYPKLLSLFGPAFTSTSNTTMLLLLSVFPYTFNTFAIVYDRIQQNILSMIVTSLVVTFSSITSIVFFRQLNLLLGISIGWLTGQLLGMAFIIIYRNISKSPGKLHALPR